MSVVKHVFKEVNNWDFMKFTRDLIDKWYVKTRKQLFRKFPDPEDAHHRFVKASQLSDVLLALKGEAS
jgi:hypothetical protein